MQVKTKAAKDIKHGDEFLIDATNSHNYAMTVVAFGDAVLAETGFIIVYYDEGVRSFVASPDYPVEVIVPPTQDSVTKEDEVQFHLDKIYFHLHHLANSQGKRYAVKAAGMLKDELQNSDHQHLGGVDGKVTIVVEDSTDKSDSRFTKQVKKLVDDYLNSKRPQDVNKEQEEVNQLIKALKKF